LLPGLTELRLLVLVLALLHYDCHCFFVILFSSACRHMSHPHLAAGGLEKENLKAWHCRFGLSCTQQLCLELTSAKPFARPTLERVQRPCRCSEQHAGVQPRGRPQPVAFRLPQMQ